MRWLLALVLLAGAADADTRPVPRPAEAVEILSVRGTTEPPAIAAGPRSTRPMERLTRDARMALAVEAVRRAPEPRIDATGDVWQSDRPLLRPANLIQAASRTPRQTQGGGVCGRRALQGRQIAPVTGPGGCGIADAVRITAVGGVTLSRPTRMTCGTARALDDWVRQGLLPTVGRTGGGAVSLQVAAGYSCRTRNSRAGARLSEHSKGNAIDISAVVLANGNRITVLDHWGRGAKGRKLRTLWQRACGPFGTVLGPESDRFHRDHFHFDVAPYRSGPYCR